MPRPLWLQHLREIQSCGNFPSLFIGLVEPDGTWEHHGGKLRFVDNSGSIIADPSDAQDCRDVIGEASQKTSYLKPPYCKPLGFPSACIASASPAPEQVRAFWLAAH